MKQETKKLLLALHEIANPIKFMQERASKEGTSLNGIMAVQLSENAAYLKSIAEKAIIEFNQKSS